MTLKEKEKHQQELLKIIENDEVVKDYIVNLYKNNYNVKEISQICEYNEYNTVQFVLKERDIKKCSSGLECKSPNGPFLSRTQFFSDSNNKDGKNFHCKNCDIYRQLYRNSSESKKKLMDYYQSLDNEKDQVNFIINSYKKLGNYHKVSKIVFCDISYIIQIMQNENIKKCTCCGKIKSRNEFGLDSSQKDGLPRFCKSCINFNAFYKKLDKDQQKLMLDFHNLNNEKLEEKFIFNLYFNHNYSYQFIRGIAQKSTQNVILIIKKFDLKRCTKCQQFKSFAEFANAITPDGKTHQCKICTNKRFQENPNVKRDYRKIYNQENQEKIQEYNKKRNISPAKFDTFAHKIQLYHNIRRDPEDQELIQVKCKLCKKWFNPTVIQIDNRYYAINGKMGSVGTENHMYCSQTCKNMCPLYNSHSNDLIVQDLIQSGYSSIINSQTRIQSTIRKFVISKFGEPDYCEKCGKSKEVSELELHHIEPVAISNILEADVDNLIWLCSECHINSHHIDGCRSCQLSEPIYC